MSDDILNQVISILDREEDMTLATQRRDGFPQANIVSYVNDGITLYFGTPETSQKAENIAFNEKVAVSINHARAEWADIEGVSLGGMASIICDPSEHSSVKELLFSKYPEIAAYTPSLDQEAVLYKIDPAVVTLLDYRRKFGFTKTIRVD